MIKTDKNMTIAAEFDGGYGRTGTIGSMTAVCDVCKQTGPCLVIDQSGGEYNAGAVCRSCALKIFDSGSQGD